MVLFGDFKFFMPELYLVGAFCILFTVLVVIAALNNPIYKAVWEIGALLTGLILIFYNYLLFNQISFDYSIFYGAIQSTSLIAISKIFITFCFILLLPFSRFYFKTGEFYQYEFYLLSLLSFLGVITMISASNFLVMYLGLELQSLAVYVLTAIRRSSVLSTEAGLRYFLLGSLASGFLLFGIALLYGLTGSIAFTDYIFLFTGNTTIDPVPIQVAMVFILGTLLFKLSAAPFHSWAPDVYQGAPTPVVAFIAILPKIAIVSLLIRFYNSFLFMLSGHWTTFFLIVTVISLVVGVLGGLYQTSIKRMLAYSTITHVGFITFAFALHAHHAVLYYITIYALVNLGLFGLLMLLRKVSDKGDFDHIPNFAVIGQTNPVIAYSLAIFLFSLAGLPPLAGFFAKYYIILYGIADHFIFLSFFALVISTVGAFYYLRVIRVLFFESDLRWTHLYELDVLTTSIVSFFVLFNIGFCFFTPYIFKVVRVCITI